MTENRRPQTGAIMAVDVVGGFVTGTIAPAPLAAIAV